jgi:hypothetical protein
MKIPRLFTDCNIEEKDVETNARGIRSIPPRTER